MNVQIETINKLITELENNNDVNEIIDVASFEDYKDIIDCLANKAQVNALIKNYSVLLTKALFGSRDYYKTEGHKTVIDLLEKLDFNNIAELANNGEYLFKVYYLYELLLMYCCTHYYSQTISRASIEEEIEQIRSFMTKYGDDIKPFSYRGLSNSSYELMPSTYRNIKEDYVHIDDEYINNHFETKIRDYKRIISNNFKDNDFYAYMQHSEATSPLLDFTNNENIAGIFACNSGTDTDAAIMLFTKNSGVGDARKRNIEFFGKKISFDSIIFSKPLYKCKIDDFELSFKTIYYKTNDRMKYQNGLFLDLLKCVYVNGHLLFPSSKTHLIKLIIPSYKHDKQINKGVMREAILEKYPYFDMKYLMDPYLWFKNIKD